MYTNYYTGKGELLECKTCLILRDSASTKYVNLVAAIFSQIVIGQHLEFTLNDTLNYGSTDTSISLDLTLALVLSIGSLLLLVIVISVVMLSVVLIYKKSRRKRICDRDQPRY